METTTRHREWHGLGQGWAHRAGSRSRLRAEEALGGAILGEDLAEQLTFDVGFRL